MLIPIHKFYSSSQDRFATQIAFKLRRNLAGLQEQLN